MNKNTLLEQVGTLIKSAGTAHDSGDAMRFSQAALNAANAIALLSNQGLLKAE